MENPPLKMGKQFVLLPFVVDFQMQFSVVW